MEAISQVSFFDPTHTSTSRRIGNISQISSHPGYYRKSCAATPSAPRQRLDSIVEVRCQTMQPIRDESTRDLIEQELLYSSEEYGLRNYLIWKVGVNTGRRCGDILTLRLYDVWNEDTQSIRNPITFYEEKTKKKTTIRINQLLAEDLRSFILEMPNRTPQTPLFPSHKSGVEKVAPNGVPRFKSDDGCLTVRAYRRILSVVAEKIGVPYLGTHSMRKTYGYCFYQKYKGQLVNGEYSALDVLQALFNHSSPRVTLRYIGIEQETCLSTFDELVL